MSTTISWAIATVKRFASQRADVSASPKLFSRRMQKPIEAAGSFSPPKTHKSGDPRFPIVAVAAIGLIASASQAAAADDWRINVMGLGPSFGEGCSGAAYSVQNLLDIGNVKSWDCAPNGAKSVGGIATYAVGVPAPSGGAFNACSGGGACESSPPIDDVGSCKTNGVRGNPTNALTGFKVESIVDFETSGPMPLKLERHFSNNGDSFYSFAKESVVGRGWRTNFDAILNYSGALGVYVVLGNGRHYNFRKTAQNPNVYVPVSYFDNSHHLRKGTGVSIVVQGDFWILTLEDGTRMHFYEPASELGKVIKVSKIEYAGGYTQNISYALQNGTNRIANVVDSYGRRLDFTIDPESGLVKSVSFNGQTVVSYAYESAYKDPASNLLAPYFIARLEKIIARIKSVSYPLNPGEGYTYHYEDDRHNSALTGKTDGRGVRTLTITYDANRRVVSSKRAGGLFEHQFQYGATSRTVTNPLGKQEIMSVSVGPAGKPVVGALTGVASANCVASDTQFEWDSNYFLSKEIDAEGRVTTYVNDPATGLPTRIVRGTGTSTATTTDVTWDSNWRQPTKVIEPGLTTDLVWDAASGRLTTVTQTDTTTHTVPFATAGRTRSWAYRYDAKGQLTSVNGPLAGNGDTVGYTYNAQGFVQTITNEIGHVTTVAAWNFRGQPTSVTDANGIVTTYTYDGMGRVTSVVVDPGENQKAWQLAYTLAGDLATFSEPKGAVYTLTWDDARRLMAIQNNLGERIEYTRDAMGNVTGRTVKDDQGNATFVETNVVDELGRLIRQSNTAPRTWKFAYDRTDLLKTVTDPRTKIVSYGYDSVGRAITETERDAGVTTLTYNGKDEIAAYKDPKNLTTSYIRNGFGEVIQETSPDRGVTKYDHDARGLTITTTDARNVVTNMTYDNAGRILTKTYPSAPALNVTYTYDSIVNGNMGKGRLTRMQDSSGSADYTYDAKGHMTKEVRTISGVAHTISYYYDGVGRLWTITYPSGRFIKYGYDALGRANYVVLQRSAAANDEPIINVGWYMPFGALRGLSFGNAQTLWKHVEQDYQVFGEQVSRDDTGAPVWEKWLWRGEDGQNLLTLADTVDESKTQALTYDDVGRLASATGVYGARSYTYDTVGNRLTEVKTPPGGTAATQTYAYAANTNRLATVKQGTTTLRTFTHDAAGNITADNRAGTTYNYTISAAGRISQVRLGTQVRADYLYDGKSRLAQSIRQNVANAGTVRYIHDHNDRIIAEVSSTGQSIREYVWLDDLPVAVLDGSVNQANPTLFFVHADHLNRPAFMSDASRARVWEAHYEPFGAVHAINGPAANDNRFPGQLFQLESGLAYNWHRHYDATIGRYVSVDPLGLQAMLSDGPSVYGYAGQSPLMWVDEDGLVKRHGSGGNLKYSDDVIRKARDLFPKDHKAQISYIEEWQSKNDCSNKRKEIFKQYIKLLKDGRLRPSFSIPIPTPPSVYCPLIGCNDGPI